MRKETFNTLCNISNPQQLDAAVVRSYLVNNGLAPTQGFISNFLKDIEVKETFNDIETIEDAISIFEQAVPADEKTKNGAIYTPKYIRNFIVNNLYSECPENFRNGLIIDPACGCGAFLYTAALVNKNTINTFRSVLRKLYGLNAKGVEFRIEKGICRDIIKPNILHNEDEIKSIMEKVIFPYDSNYKPIPEAVFISKFPKTYQYLSLHRRKLDERDKGEGNFPAWYAFGRTQAISDKGKKLLFPYMTDVPHFVFTDNENMLIYCGYAIFHNDERELKALKCILESSVFNYYMKHTSKPYATGYYSYAKNYVKNFGVYPLSYEQTEELLSLSSKEDIDEYVEHLYGVDIRKNRCFLMPKHTQIPASIFDLI